MHLCVSVYGYRHMRACLSEGKGENMEHDGVRVKCSDELSCLLWGLGTTLWSSVRVFFFFSNSEAIISASTVSVFYVLPYILFFGFVFVCFFASLLDFLLLLSSVPHQIYFTNCPYTLVLFMSLYWQRASKQYCQCTGV